MSHADPRTLSAHTASSPTFARQRPSAFRPLVADPAWSRYGQSGLDSPYARRGRWVRTDWTQSTLVPAPVSTYGALSGPGRALPGAYRGPAVQPPQADVATVGVAQQVADLVTYATTTPTSVATSFDAALNKGPLWARTPPTNTAGVWLRVGAAAEADALVRLRIANRTVPVLQDPPAVRSLTAMVVLSAMAASVAAGTSATHYLGGWLLSIGPQLAAQITGAPPPVRSNDPADMVRVYDWAIRHFQAVGATGAVRLMQQLRASAPTASARDKSGPHGVKGFLDNTPFDPDNWTMSAWWKSLPWWAKAGVVVAGGSIVVGAVGGGVGGIRKAFGRPGARKRSAAVQEAEDRSLGITRTRRRNPRSRKRSLFLPAALVVGGIAISLIDGPAPITDFVGVPMAVGGAGLLVARAGGKA